MNINKNQKAETNRYTHLNVMSNNMAARLT